MFRQARQLTTRHYQWMILHEFLPLFISEALVNEILADGRKFYRPAEAVMPVEFQGAVYRFGHSLVPTRTGRIWRVTMTRPSSG